jgi:hypothetical protein
MWRSVVTGSDDGKEGKEEGRKEEGRKEEEGIR